MQDDEELEPAGGWTPIEGALKAAFQADAERAGVRASIERRAGVDSMLVLREPEGRSRVPAARSATRVDRRYELDEELGRGGVGVVLRGHDRDLGREVALKFLRQEHAEQAFLVERFLQEAQIEGQLQHPGIVPVYELGVSPDGRPFFAMKLVRGRTLAAFLDERESLEEDRRRFLSIFEQVCQAMAYAHARGVVHRDLKPDNVMIGAFGEVQIVDWGFAKVLDAADPDDDDGGGADEAAVRTVASGPSSTATQVGSMLGTPPYMPPEQARGGRGGVDERADVFSLGAILLEILTGEAAYRGATGRDVVQKALRAELDDAHARLDACRADPDLVSLCRECLQADASDRPKDAGKVRERLTRHLTAVEERARQAELEAAEAVVRAEGERRARRLTVGLAAAILLAMVLGGGGLLWVAGERRARTERASRAVSDALAEGRELLATARGAPTDVLAPWDAALAAARSASDLSESGAPSEDVGAAATFLALVEREREGAETRKRAWEHDRATQRRLGEIRARRGEDQDLRETNAAYAVAFRDYGVDVEGAHIDAQRLRDSAIAGELAAALDEWAWIRRRLAGDADAIAKRIRDLAAAADPDPGRAVVRDAASAADAVILRELATTTHDAEAALLLGRYLGLAGREADAVRVLRATWRQRPDDFWVSFELAEALRRLAEPAWEDAIGHYRAAVAVNPRSKGARARLASALRSAGRLDEAIQLWRHALAADPADHTPYRYLVELHEERGDLEAAIAAFEAEADVAPDDPRPHVGLGLAFALRREWETAVPFFEKAAAIAPEDVAIRTHLTESLLWSGRVEDARAAIDAALAIDEDDAAAWEMRHRVLAVQGDLDGSIEAARTAADLDPETPLYLFALAAGLRGTEQLEEARTVSDRFVAMAPYEPLAHSVLGSVLMRQGEIEEAGREIEYALHLVKDGLEAAPWGISEIRVYDHDAKVYRSEWVPGWDPHMGPARYELATVKLLMGDYEGALEVLDVFPWRPEFQIAADWIRYSILVAIGRPLEALPLLESIVVDRVAGPAIHYNLGMCLLAAGRFEEGREELLAGHEACRWPPGWEYPRASWLADVDLVVELAEGLLTTTSALDVATTPQEHVLLALLLQAHGRHAEAMRAFETAFQARPDLEAEFAPWPRTYPLACVAAQEAVLTARGVGPGAAELDPPARAGCRGQALVWMRRSLETLQAAAREDPEHGPAWIRQVGVDWPGQSEYALVREEVNLRGLPSAEAEAWRAFWADLARAVEDAGP